MRSVIYVDQESDSYVVGRDGEARYFRFSDYQDQNEAKFEAEAYAYDLAEYLNAVIDWGY